MKQIIDSIKTRKAWILSLAIFPVSYVFGVLTVGCKCRIGEGNIQTFNVLYLLIALGFLVGLIRGEKARFAYFLSLLPFAAAFFIDYYSNH